MRRRSFITLIGGAAAAWPLHVIAQQSDRIRRIGILMPYPPSDAEMQSRVGALRQELQRLGWTRGVNIEFDERWTTDNLDLESTVLTKASISGRALQNFIAKESQRVPAFMSPL